MKITRTRERVFLQAAALAFLGRIRVEKRSEFAGGQYEVAWASGTALPGDETVDFCQKILRAEGAAAVLNALHIEADWDAEDPQLEDSDAYGIALVNVEKWIREGNLASLEGWLRSGEL